MFNLNYCSWTNSIKPSLVYSYIVCFPCFQMILPNEQSLLCTHCSLCKVQCDGAKSLPKLHPSANYVPNFKEVDGAYWFSGCPCVRACIRSWHLLAHLSRRLTRWAYSIPMVRRRRPHFQIWISRSQFWSNFMCNITGMGERLHKVLEQSGSKLWFPWQQKAPIDL